MITEEVKIYGEKITQLSLASIQEKIDLIKNFTSKVRRVLAFFIIVLARGIAKALILRNFSVAHTEDCDSS